MSKGYIRWLERERYWKEHKDMINNIKIDDKLMIDWSKFKSNASGGNLIGVKNRYIEFCKMLDEIDFELTSDYTGVMNKVELVYKFNNNIKLNMKPNIFKSSTYKYIINFKNNTTKNGDKLIKFVGLTSGGRLVAKIKTFDKGEVNIDIGVYGKFNKARQSTYNYCEEKGYKILSPYISTKDKILIDFNCGRDPNWIKPHNLKNNQACPICSESKGEKAIRMYLESNNIYFKQEYKFNDCRYKRSLPFDFYIPEYNLCIEYDGIQHFEVSDYFGGKEGLKLTQKLDKIKNKYCKDNRINLLRIPYYELDNVDRTLDKEFKRLRETNNKNKYF